METEYEMSFAEFLKERRTAMGITQSELGKMIHVSKSAITKWEKLLHLIYFLEYRNVEKTLF